MTSGTLVRESLRPRLWGIHLLAVAAVGLAVVLAWWQYDTWQENRAFAARQATDVPPRPLSSVMGPDAPFPRDQVGQPVRVRGTWRPQTLFVSGHPRDGRRGYWVVSPFVVSGNDSAIPVVRGWVRDPGDAPPAPGGSATLTGLLQPSQGTGEVDQQRDDRVIPQLRIASLLSWADRDLYGAFLVATSGVGQPGLAQAEPVLQPSVGFFTAWRNLAYAVEWLAFGAFAGYIWWRFIRDEARGRAGRRGRAARSP